jgi:WS/DGAT/MGAT family acyltransferase
MSPTERLNALEATFLGLESATVPFVIGSILRFDRRSELARLRATVEAALDGLPRYRQRRDRVPVLGHPIWIDDARFDIARHVLPSPAGIGDPEALAAQLLAHPLPPDRPPWQLWLVDGADGSSSVVAVVHHCLVDGVSGIHLLERVLSGVPRDSDPPRIARPAPDEPQARGRLLAREIRQRAASLARLARSARRRPPPVRAAIDLVWQGLHPASDIGLNPRHTASGRATASASIELDSLRRIRRAYGVTLNDVVLAAVAGALRRLLLRRGVDPSLARDVRAMVPVSTLRAGDDAVSGNRVALLLAQLPVDEPDPVRRLRRTAAITADLKGRSGQREAGELLVQLSDATTPAVLIATFRLALALRAFNLVITNIPGPPFPLYLRDARVDSITPFVNLWPHCALSIAVLSYDRRLFIGMQADRAVIGDLFPVADDLLAALAELAEPAPIASVVSTSR